MRAAPAVSCAIAHRKRAHEHTGSAEAIRHSLRNGFTAYIVLSPVSGLVVTVTDRITPADLAPASRRQDHTTSPYAFVHSSALARLNKSVHRIPSQRLVTMANAPPRG